MWQDEGFSLLTIPVSIEKDMGSKQLKAEQLMVRESANKEGDKLALMEATFSELIVLKRTQGLLLEISKLFFSTYALPSF